VNNIKSVAAKSVDLTELLATFRWSRLDRQVGWKSKTGPHTTA